MVIINGSFIDFMDYIILCNLASQGMVCFTKIPPGEFRGEGGRHQFFPWQAWFHRLACSKNCWRESLVCRACSTQASFGGLKASRASFVFRGLNSSGKLSLPQCMCMVRSIHVFVRIFGTNFLGPFPPPRSIGKLTNDSNNYIEVQYVSRSGSIQNIRLQC